MYYPPEQHLSCGDPFVGYICSKERDVVLSVNHGGLGSYDMAL